MKAITIWQPWATLVAIGAKKIETRGWATRYRGPLAIHAAKKKDLENLLPGLRPSIETALVEAGYRKFADLPYGAVVAVGDLVVVTAIESPPPQPEASFGDYSAGRWAWHLGNVRMLDRPVPMRGKQGLWNVDEAAIEASQHTAATDATA